MGGVYSNHKLALFPDKVQSFVDGRIAAPIYVRFKPTNKCNHSCNWCAYGHGINDTAMHNETVHKDIIPTPRVLEILHDLADIGVKAMTFSGGGEPMSHPGILAAMDVCIERGIDFSFITNGSYLYGPRLEKCKKAKWVRVSIDYWDAKSMIASRGVNALNFSRTEDNMRAFAEQKGDCSLEVNFIVTRENYDRVGDAAIWLKDVGVENVRYSPVWYDNFHEYHAPIADHVIRTLQTVKALETDKFKIFSSYRIDPKVKERPYEKCWFQQVTPVIGADECVYACHNTAYSPQGRVGSFNGRKFSEMWFSQETKAWFDGFNAQKRCNGIQCAADAKNLFYNRLVAVDGDVSHLNEADKIEVYNAGRDNFV